LRPRYAVTRERNGDGLLWRRRFTHFYKTPARTPRHTVETNLDALRRIGVYPAPIDKRLVLVPGADAERRIDALLGQHHLARGKFVHAHPGSRWLFKCAPVDRMASLLDLIVAKGLRVVVTGAPDPREREIVAQITAACAPATRSELVDLTGTLSLLELAALTAHARAFVGVDSAPTHIAAAMQTPTLAFFGPSSEHIWGPWHVPHRIVVSDSHPCRPCDLDGCGGGKVSECLTTLASERVHAQFLSLLSDTANAKQGT
jgi:heptosyltransferase-3